MKKIACIIILFFAIVSCEDATPETLSIKGKLTTSADKTHAIEFTNIMASDTVLIINSNLNWNISKEESDWMEVSPLSGTAGKHDISIKISENPYIDSRNALITIVAEDKATKGSAVKKEIDVSQVGSNSLDILNKPTETFSSDGGTFEITVSDNADNPTVEISDNAKEWLLIVPELDNRGNFNKKFKFNILGNETFIDRSAVITVRSNKLVATFDINQFMKKSFKVESTLPPTPFSSGVNTFTVTVSENTGTPTVEISDDAKSWISKSVKRVVEGIEETIYTFNVAENSSFEGRVGIITISSGDSNEELTISQLARNEIEISNKPTSMFPSSGGPFEITVSENVGNPTVEIADDAKSWLKIVNEPASRGNFNTNFKFNVLKNETFVDRTGVITVRSGDLTTTLDISQLKSESFNVESTLPSTPFSSGINTFTVTVSENTGTPTIAISNEAKSWISTNVKRVVEGIEETIYTFNVAENSSFEERVGTVTITSGDNNEVLTIRQLARNKIDILNKPTSIFSPDGGPFDITVSENVGNPTVEIADNAKSWLKIVNEPASRGKFNTNFKFNVLKNETFVNRTGVITVRSGDLTTTLDISQLRRESFSVESTLPSVPFSPGNNTFTVTVSENIGESTIEIVGSAISWISQVRSRADGGIEKSVYTFNVTENEIYEERTGTLIVRSGSHRETLTVKQEKAEDLIILKYPGHAFVEFEEINSTRSIFFIAKKNWTTEVFPVEAKAWLTIFKPIGYGLPGDDRWFNIIVSPNDTGVARSATVFIKSGNFTKTINVRQRSK